MEPTSFPKFLCGGLPFPIAPATVGGNLLLFHSGTLYGIITSQPWATRKVTLNAYKGSSPGQSSLCWFPGQVKNLTESTDLFQVGKMMHHQIMNASRDYFPYKLVKVNLKQGLCVWFQGSDQWQAFFVLWDPEEK